MMPKNRLLISALVLALVQTGFLSWIIASRAAILRNGQEVLLKVEPVDPRDLLRGDYVRLGYDISAVPVEIVVNRPTDAAKADFRSIYVRVKKGPDGFWYPASASLEKVFAAPPADGEVDLHGTVIYGVPEDGNIGVHYGIERFYLPEGEGLAIERDMRVRSFGILAAVDKNGTPQIKALMDGETKLFSEPLY
ncbi:MULTISPECIES: GDYXXLXY domain-containing protein [unclassified Mesorhizobium]|uniref:GDYXXLXY domain-containing protein n=1 Tax=unclassified Mesorhizobium TaxID=325217 RepID=UPI003014560B